MLFALSLNANAPKYPIISNFADSTLEISFITCGPGKNIYELEGHSGLRFKSDQYDFIVNWGLFDFDSPNFIYRFVKGETDYMAGVLPTDSFFNYYKSTGRKIIEQKLNLTIEEANKALYLVKQNLLPENRTYRYNYVKDNCATRPLELIENAVNDTIILGQSPFPFNSYREAMKYYHKDYPWYQFGIDLALGNGIDYTIDNREIAFAPIALKEMLESSYIGENNSRNLILETIIIDRGTENNINQHKTYIFSPIITCWFIFFLVFIITWIDIIRHKVTRLLDSILFGIYGLAGCLITFLVFISQHEATSPNALILWLNPLCLLVPTLIWLKKSNRILIFYHFINIFFLIVFVICLITLKQKINLAFLPLILCDLIRSCSYIYISKCRRKKQKNLYRNGYQQYYYSRL